MPWTVACFCGCLFDGPVTRCPRCGTQAPVEIVRPASQAPSSRHAVGVVGDRPSAPVASSRTPPAAGAFDSALSIRPTAPDDIAVCRLATLAGRPRPRDHHLLAEQDGIAVAALALTSGTVLTNAPAASNTAVRALRLRRYQLLRQGSDMAPLWARWQVN